MSDNPGWEAWRHNFDTALTAYTQAAIELSYCSGMAAHADSGMCRGEDCDANLYYLNYGPDDLAPGAAREMEQDLYGFITSCLAQRPNCFDQIRPAMVGDDFWLTRNGHGVGFWDRGLGELGDWLTGMAKPYGEASVYVGDNGSLYYFNS